MQATVRDGQAPAVIVSLDAGEKLTSEAGAIPPAPEGEGHRVAPRGRGFKAKEAAEQAATKVQEGATRVQESMEEVQAKRDADRAYAERGGAREQAAAGDAPRAEAPPPAMPS